MAQAQRSTAAVKKQTAGLTPDGLPVRGFRSLLADLAALARHAITTAIARLYPLTVPNRPTPTQAEGIRPAGGQIVASSQAREFGALDPRTGSVEWGPAASAATWNGIRSGRPGVA